MRIFSKFTLLSNVIIKTLYFCLLSLPLLTFPGAPTPNCHAGELRIFAASSLTETFVELGDRFQNQYPDERIIFNFAGSQFLCTQIKQGAEADIFASANPGVMEALTRQQITKTPHLFAHNQLKLIVSDYARNLISNIHDAARPKRLLAIGGTHVPIGLYTRQLMENLSVNPGYGAGFVEDFFTNVVSEEINVKAIVAKVALGEVDAGIVYATDISPGLKAKLLEISLPPASSPTANYLIAELNGAENQKLATLFLNFLSGQQAREILQQHGFLLPRQQYVDQL